MKTWIAPTIAVLMLAGCGKSDEPKSSPPPAPAMQPAPAPPPVAEPTPPPPAVEPAPAAAPEPAAVPEPAPAPAPATSSMETPKGGTDAHIVAKGETLYHIAKQHHVKVHDLVKWNKLSDPSHIVVGEHLRLTAPG